MSLRADEISSLIQKQIQDSDSGIELKETGRVISVGDGIARIYGLENAMSGELLTFPGDLAGMVLNSGRRQYRRRHPWVRQQY